MEFVFVLGKNPVLSAAEIASFLEARTAYRILAQNESYVLTDTEPQDWSLLGGTLKVGQVIAPSLEETDFSALTATAEDKALFSVHSFSGDREEAGEEIKRRLKEHGVRLGFSKRELTHTELIQKHVLDRGFELILLPSRIGSLQDVRQALPGRVAKTVYAHNPFEFRKRDLDRPCQRPIFSIPPRLARIMLNFAQALPGETVYDPFCGTGTILQEAALLGAKLVGSDINPDCVQWTRQNLQWMQEQYAFHTAADVFHADAQQIRFRGTVDHIVTEPDLGPPLRRPPTPKEADRILSGLIPLYTAFLAAAYTALKPGGTLSFVAPAFRKTPPREAFRKTPINRKAPLRQKPVGKSDLIQMNLSPVLARIGFSSIRNSTDADASDKTVRSIWGAKKP